MNFLRSFHDELQKAEPEPERLALYVAGMAYPTLDVEQELLRLEQITATVSRALVAMEPGYERAMRFLDVLYYDLGFVGNHENYYEPNNSFFNIVLQRRTGLPIMLSLLYMTIGKQLSLEIAGMGFPSHFMVRYHDHVGTWYIDPFHGKLIPELEVTDYLTQLFNRPITLPKESFSPLHRAC
ncbi:MAG: transglutaminase-like domain-containing protein [Caldilineaceae bacterium]